MFQIVIVASCPAVVCGPLQVSDLARSVALQEDKFIGFKDGLEHCLARYHKILGALTDAEVCYFYA